MKRGFSLLSFVFLCLILSTGNILSIPSFARKYSISCRTCHSPSMPKLKAYGDEFAGNGFKLSDYEAPRYFIDTGDPKLSLIREFPLAARLEGFVTYNMADDEKSDLGLPFNLKVLSGGQISDHLAYYFYFYMSEHGEVAGVEDAFLMFNNLFNSELDVYLGQFQVCDPLFKREVRLSLEDYRVYTSQIGISDINLKYDKGVMLTYGFPGGTDIVVEIVNGNGLTEANPWKVFDKDKYKNVMGRISQDIGENFRLGMMGYYGNEKLLNFEKSPIQNIVIFAGADATISFDENFEINLQYVYRTDDKVYTKTTSLFHDENMKTEGFLGEILFSPEGDDSKWYALGLLNLIESDFDPADYATATLHAGYILKRNVRLVSEYTLDFTNRDSKYSKVSVGFVSAF